MGQKMEYNKAMVTGGAGFIGSNLVAELLKEGLEVVSIDNYQSGKHENLAEFGDNPKFSEVNCDVTDYENLRKHMQDVDIIFNNMASKKTICLKDPRRDLEINGAGTFNLLELARDYGVKKFVHASSGSVYGEAIIHPQDENHPLIPTSYYGVSKLAGEKYVKVFNQLYGLDTTVLRYFHVYGPKQDFSKNGGVVAIFANKILHGEPVTIFGDGTQQRSFTYVQDVVNANLKVAEDRRTRGEVYNCASGVNVNLNELVEYLFGIIGKTLPIEYKDWAIGDIKSFDIDNNKIKSLGFGFNTGIEEGLQNTVDWLKDI
jgi:UDP-glucose 4-epimerase